MPAEQRANVLRLCGEWRHAERHVLINDMPADGKGKRFRCHAPAMLDIALDRARANYCVRQVPIIGTAPER
jgi:hypothetical protein